MIRLFRHYVPASLVLLAVAEFMVFFTSIYIGVELRFLRQEPGASASLLPLFPKALLFAVVMLGVMTSMGLYWQSTQLEKLAIIRQMLLSFTVGVVAMLMLFYLFPAAFIGRGAFALALLVAFPGIVVARALHHLFADHEVLKQRVLVLGAGESARRLKDEVEGNGMAPGCKIVGFVPAPGQPVKVDRGSIISTDAPLESIVSRYGIEGIIIALDELREYFPYQEILECKMNGVQITDITGFLEQRTSKIKLDTIRPSDMIFADGYSHAALASWGKRMFDIGASIMLLAVAWPVMVLTTAAILIESGRGATILYRQERVGRFGKTFDVLKFRSMRMDAERSGAAQWASPNDSRVTKVGSVIRKYRIDELPQLLNVLRGEMSFVGPRPERPQFVERLGEIIPYYNLRHKVKPGITGWAQICYPYGSSEKDALEKLQYDLYYIKNYSIWFDFMILVQTVYAVLSGRGGR